MSVCACFQEDQTKWFGAGLVERVLMIFVVLFNTGAATEHGILAFGVKTEHVKNLTIVVALFIAGQVFYFRDGLHFN